MMFLRSVNDDGSLGWEDVVEVVHVGLGERPTHLRADGPRISTALLLPAVHPHHEVLIYGPLPLCHEPILSDEASTNAGYGAGRATDSFGMCANHERHPRRYASLTWGGVPPQGGRPNLCCG